MGVTVMLTCFSTALSTIGASRQRQVLRFAGFVVGGLAHRHGQPGVPSAIPRLDYRIHGLIHTRHSAGGVVNDVQPSVIILRAATGHRFFVIHMQKFARETSLAVARDRVAGVFLGLLMMWLIFDQLWSAPASVEMRRVFISTLRLLAQFTREPVSADIRSAIQRTCPSRYNQCEIR